MTTPQEIISKRMFQLIPEKALPGVNGHAFSIGRMLIGRTEGADFIVSSNVISSIHAVLEVTPKKVMLYDMNSRNGTFVNDKKIVAQELIHGDKIKLGNLAFTFSEYTKPSELPPVLDALEPLSGEASIIQNFDLPTSLPEGIKETKVTEENVPYVVYPLGADPHSQFSEYIFEDTKGLIPIFKYQVGKQAIEIIIISNDRVYSVDYLPASDGIYYIVGANPNKKQIEFPYLAKTEKVQFIELRKGNCVVHKMHNYQLLHLTDNQVVDGPNNMVNLQPNEIVKLYNGDLEIYVRHVPAPPKVKTPPFFRLDKDLKKYLFLILLFIFTSLLGLSLFEVDKEKEEEKIPERIATILYKPSLNKTEKAVEKTEDKPKVVQKAPPKKVEPKKEPPKPKPTPAPAKTPEVKKEVTKDPGVKAAPVKQEVKKVERPAPPRKAPTPVKSANKQVTARTTRPRPSRRPMPTTKSAATTKSLGSVDVYRSNDFKSTINNLVAKGGSVGATATTSAASTEGISGTSISGVDSRVKVATSNGQVGSLTGAATGKLDVSKGAEGLSAKKGIYTAGIPAETVVLGSIDPDTIRRILQEHVPQFRYCYQRELDAGRDAYSGVVGMEFTIGASGHVTRASVGRSSNAPASVRGCIASVLRGIQFPRPMGGGTVDVKQPLNLSQKDL